MDTKQNKTKHITNQTKTKQNKTKQMLLWDQGLLRAETLQ